jgi:hypothetical protein
MVVTVAVMTTSYSLLLHIEWQIWVTPGHFDEIVTGRRFHLNSIESIRSMTDRKRYTTVQALGALLQDDNDESDQSSGSDLDIQTQVSLVKN